MEGFGARAARGTARRDTSCSISPIAGKTNLVVFSEYQLYSK
jgi:hypothetical protein